MSGKKIILIALLVLVIVLSVLTFAYRRTIFQEGNPIPLLKGMRKLDGDTAYVQIKDDPVTYMTRTNDRDALFAYIADEKDVAYKEQSGAAHIFEGENATVILTSRQYTGRYQVWEYTERGGD